MDENGCIILKYKDGAMATLSYHTSAVMADNDAVIYGDKDKLKVNSLAVLFNLFIGSYGLYREKTCIRGFQYSNTQTSLLSYRD